MAKDKKDKKPLLETRVLTGGEIDRLEEIVAMTRTVYSVPVSVRTYRRTVAVEGLALPVVAVIVRMA